MAVIYKVEQLQALYQDAQTATNEERKRLLNFIVTESVNTVNIYLLEMERAANLYGIVLKKEEIQKNVIGIAQTVGIASTNIYGYVVAGLAYVYDALTKKSRTEKINAAIAEVEKIKAKATAAAQLYETAKSNLTQLKIKEIATSPIVWLAIVLVLIIYFSR
ncbi:hypothetical protein [Runella sp.]|uniref:hypothetical protein n=1 Tax=Runella sp. TaxID=1960881 RepID=UPI003D0B4CD1